MSGTEGIVHLGSVFHPRSAAELTEEHYERLFMQHAQVWFPEWIVVPFKQIVASELYQRTARPDLAIIHHGLKNWYVVEVELTSHSLSSHVLPQVITLKDAYYSRSHARYLFEKSGNTFQGQREDFVRLITNIQPEVYVVAEAEGAAWRNNVEAEGCLFLVFQPYRDDRGRWCYRFDGEMPTVEKRLLSYCSAARQFSMMNCLQVENQDAVPLNPDGYYGIVFEGTVYKWKIVRVEESAFLMTMGAFPYDLSGNRWALWLVDGHLHLKRTPSRRIGGRV